MRVLAANKFYFVGGGSETVFFRTTELLESAGHEVVPFAMRDPRNRESPWSSYFARTHDYAGSALNRGRDAVGAIYSVSARHALHQLISASSPDVAHLHNVYHQLSLSVIDELRSSGVPAVMTLHDYKPVCPAYRLIADDGRCQRCLTGAFWNAVVHRCLKGSRGASTVVALEAYISRYRRQYGKLASLIAPSRFLADLLVRGGVDHRTLVVLPNFVHAAAAPRSSAVETHAFVYAGRLSGEKGLHVLLDASQKLRDGAQIRIAGAGPLEDQLRHRIQHENLNAVLLGQLDPTALAREIRAA